MTYYHEVEISCLGGLPILVLACVRDGDESVGERGSCLDDWEILRVANRKCKRPPMWLYNAIADRDPGFDQRLMEAL
jgi:hypothetical protein